MILEEQLFVMMINNAVISFAIILESLILFLQSAHHSDAVSPHSLNYMCVIIGIQHVNAWHIKQPTEY